MPRRLNEAADALAKAASGRELVPTGVFTSDQHKPSVCYEGSEQANNGPPNPASGANQLTAPSSPEVMELEQDLVTEPILWSTGERSTSTTYSMMHCR